MSDLPNIVIVMPDELRQQAVGLTKTDPVITPNIDAFSKEAATLTNALSNCPICSPARAMLFSGKYPVSNGVIDNCYSRTIEYGIELKKEEVCFSDVLSESGYDLGYIGKYHLDLPNPQEAEHTEGWRGDPNNGGTLWDAFTAPDRRHGFNFWYSYGCCDRHLTPHYWKNDAAIENRTDINGWSVEHETDVAIDYVRNKNGAYRDGNKPFLLFVSHNPPHMPFEDVPEKYKALYKDFERDVLLNRPNIDHTKINEETAKNYYAAITGVDEQFGRLLKTIEEEQIDDNTIVFFLSDHGEMLGSHGLMGKNSWYNEAFSIPFIVKWKDRIVSGRQNWFMSLPDFFPTLLGLVGLTEKLPADVEGFDKSALLLGQQSHSKGSESGFYISSQPFFPETRKGIKTDRYTFVVIYEKNSGALSNVVHDNLLDGFQVEKSTPVNLNTLTSKLIDWLMLTNDPWLKDDNIMLYIKELGSN